MLLPMLLLRLTLAALAFVLVGCASAPLGGIRGIGGGTADPRRAQGFSLVLIDAGHGGQDNGGQGNGLREKDLALDTAQRLATELRGMGIATAMTRDDDRFIELDDRVALANRRAAEGAVLVSIHYNAGGRNAQGAMTFYWKPNSVGLATHIQRALVGEAGQNDMGTIRRRIRLTRNPEIPSVLVECGFVTNAAEAARLGSPEFRQRLARAIASGIRKQYYEGDAGIPPVPEIASPLSRASDRKTF